MCKLHSSEALNVLLFYLVTNCQLLLQNIVMTDLRVSCVCASDNIVY